MSRKILAPPLQRMGPNRSYRVNTPNEEFSGSAFRRQQQQQQSNAYTEEDLYAEDDDDDGADGAYTIEELPDSLFKLTFHVPSAFYGGVIGTKGSTKRRIESETQTVINVPRPSGGYDTKKSEDIIIKGSSRSSVCAARRKINLLTYSLRKRMRATHFISVPINKGDVIENFMKFKQQILDDGLPGITDDLFQRKERLHLTLIVCVLLDEKERVKAVELLKSCRKFLNDIETPISLKVAGLKIMNDDPSSVRILYADVNSPELSRLGDRIYETFIQSGFSFEEYSRKTVKLHMTLINTKFVQAEDEKNKPSKFIDARDILKRYGDFDFGSTECNELQLCVMTSNEGRDVPYKITGALNFS